MEPTAEMLCAYINRRNKEGKLRIAEAAKAKRAAEKRLRRWEGSEGRGETFARRAEADNRDAGNELDEMYEAVRWSSDSDNFIHYAAGMGWSYKFVFDRSKGRWKFFDCIPTANASLSRRLSGSTENLCGPEVALEYLKRLQSCFAIEESVPPAIAPVVPDPVSPLWIVRESEAGIGLSLSPDEAKWIFKAAGLSLFFVPGDTECALGTDSLFGCLRSITDRETSGDWPDGKTEPMLAKLQVLKGVISRAIEEEESLLIRGSVELDRYAGE